MKLYGFPPSPNTWKVRAHLGLPLEFEFVDVTEPRAPEYLVLNPTGRMPVLVDDNFKLWESNAIMQCLASRSP
jgi:glutathione S-transferase